MRYSVLFWSQFCLFFVWSNPGILLITKQKSNRKNTNNNQLSFHTIYEDKIEDYQINLLIVLLLNPFWILLQCSQTLDMFNFILFLLIQLLCFSFHFFWCFYNQLFRFLFLFLCSGLFLILIIILICSVLDWVLFLFSCWFSFLDSVLLCSTNRKQK